MASAQLGEKLSYSEPFNNDEITGYPLLGKLLLSFDSMIIDYFLGKGGQHLGLHRAGIVRFTGLALTHSLGRTAHCKERVRGGPA